MTSPTPSAEPDSATLAADAAYYRRVLHGLIDLGADMAPVVHEQTAHPVAPEPALDMAMAFERISRAVRRTINLARKLADPVKASTARDPGVHRAAARMRIIRAVGESIDSGATDAEASDMREELADRMDAPDVDDDIDQRPIEEIIGEICRELGIEPIIRDAGAAGGAEDRAIPHLRAPAVRSKRVRDAATGHARRRDRRASEPAPGRITDQPHAPDPPDRLCR